MNGSGDYQAVIATPMGRIGIRMSDKAVSALDYLPADAAEQAPVNAATEAVVTQLIAYFHHPLASFNVPLAPAGTAFQQRVWVALQAIPTGSVLSYGCLLYTSRCV